MKLYIPKLRTRLVLKKSWTFPLYYEIRNERLFESKLGKRVCRPHERCKSKPVFGLEPLDQGSNHGNSIYDTEDPRCLEFLKEQAAGKHNLRLVGNAHGGRSPCIDVTFQKDTVLTVDKIHIRKGAREFSAISFYAKEPTSSRAVRFWTRLDDVNGIEVVEVEEEKPVAPALRSALWLSHARQPQLSTPSINGPPIS